MSESGRIEIDYLPKRALALSQAGPDEFHHRIRLAAIQREKALEAIQRRKTTRLCPDSVSLGSLDEENKTAIVMTFRHDRRIVFRQFDLGADRLHEIIASMDSVEQALAEQNTPAR